MEDHLRERGVVTDGTPVYSSGELSLNSQSSGESKKGKKKRHYWKRRNSKALNATLQTEDEYEGVGEITTEVIANNSDSEGEEKEKEEKQEEEYNISDVQNSIQEVTLSHENIQSNKINEENNRSHSCLTGNNDTDGSNSSQNSVIHIFDKDESSHLYAHGDLNNVENLVVDGQIKATSEVISMEEMVESKEHALLGNEDDFNDKMFLLKESKTYEVENYSKNSMIIFNHFDIKGYDKRYGTEKDVEALKETFSKLGFKDDIIVHDDLDYRGIYKALEEYSSSDFTQHGCVMVVVLTHGSDGGFIRAKDRSYHESELISHFFDKHNRSLITKPIVFLIQACRGTKASKAVIVGLTSEVQRDTAMESRVYTLPTEADVLLLHSSYAGTAAHREIQNGSWFIQTFCQYVERFADTMDLEAIMIDVKNDVAINKQHLVHNKATSKTDMNKQIPVVMSTLIRKLYFKKPSHILIEPETRNLNVSFIDNPSESNIDSPSMDYRRFVLPKQHFLNMRNVLQIFHEREPASTSKILLNIANSIDVDVVPDITMDTTAREISEYLKKHAINWNLYNMILFLKDL